MFERFTDQGRRIVVIAQEHSRANKDDHIGPNHLALAILDKKSHTSPHVFLGAIRRAGYDADELFRTMQLRLTPGDKRVGGHIPLLPETRTTIEYSLREALQLGDDFVSIQHLFLGLIREGSSDLAVLLTERHSLVQWRRFVADAAPSSVTRGRTGEDLSPTPPDDPEPQVAAPIEGLSEETEREIEEALTLPGFASDSVHGEDFLSFAGDAAVLATLVCSRDISPPLSVALFGDWGSGKTFLLNQLRQAIADLAATDDPAYVHRVRHVMFNAWHFADTDLWPSLVSHLFEELSRDEDTRVALQESLLLESDSRPRLGKEIARLENRQRELTAQLRQHRPSGDPTEITKHGHMSKLEADRLAEEVREFGEAAGLTSPSVEELEGWVQGAKFALARPSKLVSLLAHAPVFVAGAVLTCVTIALGILGYTDRIVSIGATIFGVLVAGWAFLERTWKATERARVVMRTLASAADEERRELERMRDDTEAELAELSRARDALGVAGRWRQLIAAAQEHKGYRERLGVISQIRRDLEFMALLMAEQGADAPVERIVLYIDDLDRCSSKRVVEVLEAVHLVLAIPLFVVVVAVDQRWLERSLRKEYIGLLEPGDGDRSAGTDWAATPENYLEKIFQIPYSVPQMARSGYDSLIHGLLPVKGSDDGASMAESTGSYADVDAASVDDQGTDVELGTDSGILGASAGRALGAKALKVDRDEVTFLAALFHLASTPRAAKRLTNTYRLIRVSLAPTQLEDFLKSHEYRVVGLLLAMVSSAHRDTGRVFKSFCDSSYESLAEVLSSDGIQRTDLGQRLIRTRSHLRDAGVHLIEDLSVYRRWIPTVARFSFRRLSERSGKEDGQGVDAAHSLKAGEPDRQSTGRS